MGNNDTQTTASASAQLSQRAVFIDPSYSVFNENELFKPLSQWNRDDHLSPFHRMRSYLVERGISVNTADLMLRGKDVAEINDYSSFGALREWGQLKDKGNVFLRSFVIMEPPLIAPDLYEALPQLTANFDEVFVHNAVGDGYSMDGVDQSKLRKLYWPQPYFGVIEKFWSVENRLNRIVVINGNHKPRSAVNELYSKRILAMAALSKFDAIDLYGRGWGRWWSRNSLWAPYWLNLRKLMSIYKGACSSKYETLSKYRFCLCFENMQMTGYVTEKIFDSLYAGTIPLYLGAPDIISLIPADAYIDCRKFSSWKEMWFEINRMTDSEVNVMREAGRRFLGSDEFKKYYNSLQEIVS